MMTDQIGTRTGQKDTRTDQTDIRTDIRTDQTDIQTGQRDVMTGLTDLTDQFLLGEEIMLTGKGITVDLMNQTLDKMKMLWTIRSNIGTRLEIDDCNFCLSCL